MSEVITLGAAIVAVIEWIKSIDTQNRVSTWITLPVALIIGGLAGYFHVFGTSSIELGLTAGFIAVGAHTVASAAGGR